jgi:hypothetical protein
VCDFARFDAGERRRRARARHPVADESCSGRHHARSAIEIAIAQERLGAEISTGTRDRHRQRVDDAR